MPDLVIRNLAPDLKAALAERAKANGRSVSREADQLLRRALALPAEDPSAWEALRKHVEPFGGFDIELPPRGDGGRPLPDFE